MGQHGTTSQSLPAWAQPFAKGLLQTGFGTISPGNPMAGPWNAFGLPGQFSLQEFNPELEQKVVGFTPAQLAGLDVTKGTAGTSLGLAESGAGELNRTLQGAYLSPDANPYLNQTYGAAARGLTDQYSLATAPSIMANAQRGGVSGGSAEGQTLDASRYSLGQNLADLATQIYGGNYEAERGRQAAAPGMVGAGQASLAAPGQQLLGAGTLEQSQAQAETDAARANAELRQQWPYTLMSYFGNLLGSATTGGGTVTATAGK